MVVGSRLIALVGSFGLLITLSGCGKQDGESTSAADKGTKSGKDGKSAPKADDREKAAATAEPAFTFKADEWVKEWKKDVAAAKSKYGKKVVQLTGVVEVVLPDPQGNYGLVKIKDGDDNLFLCNMIDREPWWKVSEGSKVTVKGTASAESKDGDLLDAVFVDAGKNPALSVTAVDLSKEYAGNKDSAKKKYDDMWVIVEGELQETKPANNQLVIKGEGPVKIVCSFAGNAIDKERMDAVKAGQTVKVVGKAAMPGSGNEIALKYCMMSAKAKK